MEKSKNGYRAYAWVNFTKADGTVEKRHKMIASGSADYCSETLAHYLNKKGPDNEGGGVIPYDFQGDPWQKEWPSTDDYGSQLPPPSVPPKLKSVGVEDDKPGNCESCEL